MKLVVLKWLRESFTPFMGKLIEVLFRLILFILPLGVFLILIQFREKASKVSNLSVYTKDESTWQHVFPGFILISITPETFKKNMLALKRDFQTSIHNNKYLIETIFMIVVILLLFRGIK